MKTVFYTILAVVVTLVYLVNYTNAVDQLIDIDRIHYLLCDNDNYCSVENLWPVADSSLIVARVKTDISFQPGTYKTWFLDISDDTVKKQLLLLDNHYLNDAAGHDIILGFDDNIMTIKEPLSHRGYLGRKYELQLRPLAIKSEGDWSDVPAGGPDVFPPFYNCNWNWLEFRGEGINRIYNLGESYRTEPPFRIHFPCLAEKPFYIIPRMEIDGLDTVWDNITLGNCALDVGQKNTPGFILEGNSADVHFKVLVISDTEFLIEVMEPINNSDYLEIWQRIDISDKAIIQPKSIHRLYHWSIRIADGKVSSSPYNHGKLPETIICSNEMRLKKHKSIIFKIRLPYPIERASSLAVSYVKADEDENVISKVSTSQLIPDNCYSLSMVKLIDSELVEYSRTDRKLNIRSCYKLKPNLPIIDLTGNSGLLSDSPK